MSLHPADDTTGFQEPNGKSGRTAEADCDCCGKRRRLSQVFFAGLETWACAECRGDDEDAYDE
jgi:hypothetical protein